MSGGAVHPGEHAFTRVSCASSPVRQDLAIPSRLARAGCALRQRLAEGIIPFLWIRRLPPEGSRLFPLSARCGRTESWSLRYRGASITRLSNFMYANRVAPVLNERGLVLTCDFASDAADDLDYWMNRMNVVLDLADVHVLIDIDRSPNTFYELIASNLSCRWSSGRVADLEHRARAAGFSHQFVRADPCRHGTGRPGRRSDGSARRMGRERPLRFARAISRSRTCESIGTRSGASRR